MRAHFTATPSAALTTPGRRSRSLIPRRSRSGGTPALISKFRANGPNLVDAPNIGPCSPSTSAVSRAASAVDSQGPRKAIHAPLEKPPEDLTRASFRFTIGHGRLRTGRSRWCAPTPGPRVNAAKVRGSTVNSWRTHARTAPCQTDWSGSRSRSACCVPQRSAGSRGGVPSSRCRYDGHPSGNLTIGASAGESLRDDPHA